MPGDRLQVWNPDENRWEKYTPSESFNIPWWVGFVPSRLVYLDDFEGVLKWKQQIGTISKVSDIHAFESSNSMKLVTGALAGDHAQARQYFANLREAKYKVGLWWHAANAAVTTLRIFELQLQFYTGTHFYQCVLRYNNRLTVDQHFWSVMCSGVNWCPIPNGSEVIHTDGTYHNYLEIGFDLSPEIPKYTSFKSNALHADIGFLSPHKIPDTTHPYTAMMIHQTTDVALASTVYVDALVLAEVK